MLPQWRVKRAEEIGEAGTLAENGGGGAKRWHKAEVADEMPDAGFQMTKLVTLVFITVG